MVDDVEIKNVGGKFGVASEATMQLILAALGGHGSAGAGRAQNLASAGQQRAARSTAELNKQQGLLVSGFKGAVGAVGGFTKAFFGGANSISEFSNEILGNSNLLSKGINRLTEYVDSNISSLRELSSVGASFNNSIFDMRDAAARGEMSFTDFSDLIGKNSSTLALLGGTVTGGAKQVAIFTKTLRTSDVGKQLMGMGFTIADINQGMTDYLDLQIQSGKKINFRDKTLIAGSEAYLKQLDSLAKVTGKQRDQISKDLLEQLSDAGVRNRVNALTGAQQTNFTSTLEYINSSMPGLSSGLKDLMDGVAQTDMGKLMQSQIQGLGPLMEKVFAGQISEVDFQKALKGLQPQIDAFQKMYPKEMLDAMRQGGGIGAAYADLADNLNELNKVMNQDMNALAKEATQRNKLTELFAAFPQTIETARSRMVDAFIDSDAFKALEALGAKILSMVSGTGAFGTLESSFNDLSVYMLGPDGVLTKAINAISTQLTEFSVLVNQGGFLYAFETKLSELGSWIANWFKDVFFGKDITSRDRQGVEHQKGLIEKAMDGMSSAFDSFWDGPYGVHMADKIVQYFGDVANSIIDHITGGGKQTPTSIATGSTITTPMGAAVNKVTSTIGLGDMFGASINKDDFLGQATRSTQWWSQRGIDSYETGQYLASVYDELQKSGQYKNSNEAKAALEKSLKTYIDTNYTDPAERKTVMDYFNNNIEKQITDLPQFATGTTGFQSFGTETPAMLHGVEAVVPRNTMAGDFLSKAFGSDWNNPKPTTSAPQTSNLSQETLVKLSNQLNTIMMAILAEIKKNNDIEKKTLTSVKGLNSDLYRGI